MFTATANVIEERKIIPMSAMKPLQIGKLLEGEHKGEIVMRTSSEHKFEVMVIYPEPEIGNCWIFEGVLCEGVSLNVELLPKGSQITLTVS